MLADADRIRHLLAEDPLRIHERGAHDFALLWYPVLGKAPLEILEQLLAAGAEVERQHSLGTTALHYAALGGQLETVAFLLESGADPGRVGKKFDPAGQTPRQLAEQRGHTEVAEFLRQRGG
jgi:ankyrin repeat protein